MYWLLTQLHKLGRLSGYERSVLPACAIVGPVATAPIANSNVNTNCPKKTGGVVAEQSCCDDPGR